MATFFTSDTHFGDGAWLGLGKRPFAGVAAMDDAMIARWNERVGPADTVWHLGDVARRPGAVPDLLTRLNGTKHLIRGNNDPPATGTAIGWESVADYAEIEEAGRRLVLCHYPFRSWNRQGQGSINLHGHSHGRLAPVLRQFDVGVDPQGFRPVTLAELLSAARGRSRS